MQADILAIGTELLLGQIVDTNSAWIARQLAALGIDHYFNTVVGDNLPRIREVLAQAHARSEVVITTGGIGPTVDDVTRQAVADVVGVELEFHQHLLDHIEEIFRRAGYRQMFPGNRQQAYVPTGAIILENPKGTAPAFIAEDDRGIIVSLPGVPHEMRYLMETRVMPHIKEKFRVRGLIKYKTLVTVGIGESALNEKIRDLMASPNPSVGTLAGAGMVSLRIAVKAEDEAEADAMIALMEQGVRAQLGDYVYGEDDVPLEAVVGGLLCEHRKTLAIYEATTAGAVCHRLSALPGHGTFFAGGAVASRGEMRRMAWEGSEREGMAPQYASAEGTERLADGVRRLCGADIGLAIDSDRRPEDGDSLIASSPVYLALAAEGVSVAREHRFGGEMAWVQQRSSNLALDLVRRYLLGKLDYH